MLKRISWLPERDANLNGSLIAGQDYDNVYIAGGEIINVTIDADSLILDTPLEVSSGGTGASNETTARQNLGLEIGVDVQAHSSVLDATTASFTTADESKLDGIEAGAQVNPTTEEIQDAAWNVLTGTQTGITVTYQDATNDVDFVVGGLTVSEFASANISQWTNDANFVTTATAIDAIEAANNTFTGTNIFQGVIDVTNVNAEGSSGGNLRTSGGANCLSWGSGGSANVTLGGNMSGASVHKLVNMADPTDAQDYATKNYVDNNSFASQSPAYDSGNQTYTAGSKLTLAHSLGYTPLLWRVYLVCTTAEDDFSVGDLIEVANWNYTQGSTASYNWQTKVGGTNFEITMGASGLLALNDSAAVVALTASNFRLRVIAW
jgi:hypothetical protein